MERYLKLFTFIPIPEIATIMEEQNQDPSKRVAQHRLAFEFVHLIHGQDEANAVSLQHRQLFRPRGSTDEPSPLPRNTKPSRENPLKVTAGMITPQSGNPFAPQTNFANMGNFHVTLPRSLVYDQPFNKILWSAGIVSSKGEGHRVIRNNGATVGCKPGTGEAMGDNLTFMPIKIWHGEKTAEFIVDDQLIVKLGKWKLRMIRVISDEDFRAQGLTAPGWDELTEDKPEQTEGKSEQ